MCHKFQNHWKISIYDPLAAAIFFLFFFLFISLPKCFFRTIGGNFFYLQLRSPRLQSFWLTSQGTRSRPAASWQPGQNFRAQAQCRDAERCTCSGLQQYPVTSLATVMGSFLYSARLGPCRTFTTPCTLTCARCETRPPTWHCQWPDMSYNRLCSNFEVFVARGL